MKFKEITKDKLKRKYEFTLKASDLNKEVDSQLQKEQPSIQMKGFRKGKVPISLLKKMHGEALLSEVMKSSTDTAVKNHFEKEGDKPAYEPKIELMNKEWKSGDDVQLSIEYECMPKIPELDLSKIVLENVVAEPDKKSLDEAMNSVRESGIEYKPVKEGGKSKKKDQVTLDFEGFIDGKPFENGSSKDFPLVLGSNSFIPGFEDQLIGVQKNDEKIVKVAFPESYGNKELSGKDAEFKCKIKEISSPVLPKVDDQLAKKFGLENLKQLQENLEKQVKGEFEQASRVLLKKQLMDKLEKELKFELPESLVTTEANSIAKHQNNETKQSSKPDEKPVATTEDKKIAERRVRVGLFFAEFGIQKKLDLTEAELNAAFEAESTKYPGQEQDYLKFIQSNSQAQQAIRGPLFEEKVVNSILENVSLKEKKLSVDKFKEQMEKLN
ncbi:trigger factor [Paracoccaceae bacterium]|nr:trigger factor [Paracoccaceae bacterium]